MKLSHVVVFALIIGTIAFFGMKNQGGVAQIFNVTHVGNSAGGMIQNMSRGRGA
jgi:hypothetical protein